RAASGIDKAHFVSNMRRISSAFLTPNIYPQVIANLFLFFNVWLTFWHALLITTQHKRVGR
ncbi:TPA: hypothetical protein ACYZVF_004593, partial [Escherichia coli]